MFYVKRAAEFVSASFAYFGSGSCLCAFQIDGRSTTRKSVWMKPEILLLIPGNTSNGRKWYRRPWIKSRTFSNKFLNSCFEEKRNEACHTRDVKQ